MKRMPMRVAVAGAAAAGLLFAASPAQAADDPAVVSCSFAGLYESYDGTGGAGLLGYTARDDRLTVTGGNDEAWEVHVDSGFLSGQTGWIETGCVSFLA